MNRKIEDGVIAIMSCVGTIWTIIEFIINPLESLIRPKEISEKEAVVRIILGVAFLVFAVVFVLRIRKEHTTLYDIQHTMAKNNKLHPLRALAMILYDYEERNHNRLHIKTATFSYKLQKNENPKDGYNVDYTLQFEVKKKWYQLSSNSHRIFKFYAISEYGSDLENISLLINGQEFFPVVSSCTTKGESGDLMGSFAGLFKIQTIIPSSLSLKESIHVEIKYTVNYQIKETDQQYSFVIIPQNYSKKIERINIQLFTETKISNLFCHGIAVNEKLEQAGVFARSRGNNQLYETEFSPKMKTVYFVQFEFPKNKNRRKNTASVPK